MKKTLLAIAAMLVMTGTTFAVDPVICNQTQQGQGQKAGKRGGKKIGPQDGSGPIHQPGTGGGTGAGNRRGRK
ncbi:MAG: hypothetical protein ACE15B_21685 [Bryobacteraceae bacterium]